MQVIKRMALCILLFWSFSNAKNTFSSFSVGLAIPVTYDEATTVTGKKELNLGWDGAWTFFGKPFSETEKAYNGLAFGGKISYSRWVRDSTFTPVTFLGTQGIIRYYIPPVIKPFDLFCQSGAGMFIGEYSFTDPDTTDWKRPPFEIKVIEGKKIFGASFGIGINWDVIEILPILTVVFTKDKKSAWLSINAAMTF